MDKTTIVIFLIAALLLGAAFWMVFNISPKSAKKCECKIDMPNQDLQFIGGEPTNFKIN